jgi:hypothetical protein
MKSSFWNFSIPLPFEYALKRAGYRGPDGKAAAADWDRFEKDLTGLTVEELAPVLACGDHILAMPAEGKTLRTAVHAMVDGLMPRRSTERPVRCWRRLLGRQCRPALDSLHSLSSRAL